MSILIQNGTLLLPEGPRSGLALGIEGNRIVEVGSDLEPRRFDTVLEASGQLVLPGLVNAHTHLAMVLLRGYADEMPLQPWLETKVWPAEAQLTAERVYWGSLLGCIELIRGGVTAFCDMYFHMGEVARAVEQAGLRALLSYGMIAPEPGDQLERELQTSLELVEAWHGQAEGRLRVALAPHAQYTGCDALWEKSARLAREKGLGLNTHLAETRREVATCREKFGHSPVVHLDELGAFQVPTLAAHCVHVDAADVEILAQRGVSVSHNPGSNLKLGSGIAPLPRLLEAGITVALGTDGAASNNNLNLFEELQLAALLHKGVDEDARAIPAGTAVELATQNGYRALGFADGGALRVGALADLTLVDLNGAHVRPVYQPLSALAYAAQASDVRTTIVNGRLLMKDRVLLTLDEADVYHHIEEIVKAYS